MKSRNADSPGAKIVKASVFKAKCLNLMNEVAESGTEYVITKNGRPVSRLVPYHNKPKSLFGLDRDRLEILGDIDKPLDVEWEAATGQLREDDHCSS